MIPVRARAKNIAPVFSEINCPITDPWGSPQPHKGLALPSVPLISYLHEYVKSNP